MEHLINSFNQHIYKLRYGTAKIWFETENGLAQRSATKDDLERLEAEVTRLEGI